MFKVLSITKDLGGTLDLQAETKGKAFAELEAKLNSLPVTSVSGIFPSQDDSKFQLIAVVDVAEKPAPAKGKGDK